MFTRDPKDLAVQLMNQRKKLKLSQRDVADRVGLKQKTISAFENNPEGAQISTLFRIIAALDLNINLASKAKKATSVREWGEEW